MTAYARKGPGKTTFYVVKLVRLEKKLKSQVQKWLEFWPLNLDYGAFMTFFIYSRYSRMGLGQKKPIFKFLYILPLEQCAMVAIEW